MFRAELELGHELDERTQSLQNNYAELRTRQQAYEVDIVLPYASQGVQPLPVCSPQPSGDSISAGAPHPGAVYELALLLSDIGPNSPAP